MPQATPTPQTAKERLSTTIHLLASLSQATIDSKILQRPPAAGTRPHLEPIAAARLEVELTEIFVRHFPGVALELLDPSQSTLPTPPQSHVQRRSNHTHSTRHP